MKKVVKLLKALMPRILDVCVYKYMLSVEPLHIEPSLSLDVEVKKKDTGYSFYAKNNGATVNENHIIFHNRLGNQLGYDAVPMLADSNTYERFRGKGIQAYMLAEIARYFANLRAYDAVYVFTYTDNIAMQRSLSKANYTKLYRAQVYRIAGICVYKRSLHG